GMSASSCGGRHDGADDGGAVRAGPAAVGGTDRPGARRVAAMKRLDGCTVDGCDNVNLNARGLCQTHYSRMLRYGDPRHVEKPRLALSGFGWWLARKLAERDMSWRRLAVAAGVSDRAIGYWRSGRNYPTVLQVAALADVLGVEVSDVVDAIVADARERGEV